MKTGLVLEGGGLRGIYTVGVLDVLMEEELFPDYAVGVSAGAANAVSYLSGQKGRGYRVNTQYLGDKRYMSLSNLIRKHSLFGMDLIFDEIPNALDTLDYEAIQRSPIEFYTGVTSCEDGQALYFGKEYLANNCDLLCASASIPIISRPVEIDGIPCVDGGVADPIPVQKALDDGCEQIVAVLTQPRGYRQSRCVCVPPIIGYCGAIPGWCRRWTAAIPFITPASHSWNSWSIICAPLSSHRVAPCPQAG